MNLSPQQAFTSVSDTRHVNLFGFLYDSLNASCAAEESLMAPWKIFGNRRDDTNQVNAFLTQVRLA
jgi:hypothetical protein